MLYCAEINKQGLPRLLQGPYHGGSVEVKRRLWPAQPWASLECFVKASPFWFRVLYGQRSAKQCMYTVAVLASLSVAT